MDNKAAALIECRNERFELSANGDIRFIPRVCNKLTFGLVMKCEQTLSTPTLVMCELAHHGWCFLERGLYATPLCRRRSIRRKSRSKLGMVLEEGPWCSLSWSRQRPPLLPTAPKRVITCRVIGDVSHVDEEVEGLLPACIDALWEEHSAAGGRGRRQRNFTAVLKSVAATTRVVG
jgi:hypothetical protein